MLKALARDDSFLETILVRMTVCALLLSLVFSILHNPSNCMKPNTEIKLSISKSQLPVFIRVLTQQDSLKFQNPKEPNADSLAMLLANLSKSDSLSRLLTLKRSPMSNLSNSPLALDQLIELFNRGTNKGYNPAANFDYLAYVFADLAKVIQPHLFSNRLQA